MTRSGPYERLEGWRERMGIEPTRSLFPDPSPVLKTGAGTSRTHAPL